MMHFGLVSSFLSIAFFLSGETARAQAPRGGAPAGDQPIAPVDGYSFNPLAVKRDPFSAPEQLKGKSVNDLIRYDLNEMNLVAILTGVGASQAMIVLPNKKTHIVKVGDIVGRYSGKVSKITKNEVIIKEVFKDYQDRVKTNLTSLVLAE